MKVYFLFYLFFLQLTSLWGQGKQDTSFLMKKFDSNGYRAVFVDTPNSINHNRVFDLLTTDSIRYKEIIMELDSTLKSKKKHAHYLTSGEWISIHLYNEKLYAYSPSEPYYNLFLNVKDSFISINDFNEGIIPFAITKCSSNSNETKIIYKLHGLNQFFSEIIFQFINKDKTIAILDMPNSTNRYIVVAKKQQFYQFPIIVNFCPEARCLEWSFRKINGSNKNKLKRILK